MKPILFNTEMVRAILDGRKTVTRRVVKLDIREQFKDIDLKSCDADTYGKNSYCLYKRGGPVGCWNEISYPFKPKYKIGDILYIRETWNQLCRVDKDGYTNYNDLFYVYKADKKQPDLYDADGFCLEESKRKWKPSIHMPKEAARLFLRVTDVRVEKLQDITTYGCINEGALTLEEYHEYDYDPFQPIASFILFSDLWNSTVDKKELDKYGWDANPWVFVYEFEVISKEEAYRSEEH